MKKYIKPSIEVIEAALTKDCMLGASLEVGNKDNFAPSRKDVVDDTDLNDGWN